MYKAKRKRHVCSIKGCRNREVILFARSSEIGGGVYLCKECIEELSKCTGMFDDVENTESVVEKPAKETVKEKAKTTKSTKKDTDTTEADEIAEG